MCIKRVLVKHHGSLIGNNVFCAMQIEQTLKGSMGTHPALHSVTRYTQEAAPYDDGTASCIISLPCFTGLHS